MNIETTLADWLIRRYSNYYCRDMFRIYILFGKVIELTNQ